MPVFENHTCLLRVGEVEFLGGGTELLSGVVPQHRGPAAEGERGRDWRWPDPAHLPPSLPLPPTIPLTLFK